MKIAVTYENGNVFQHFGKTEFFKVFEVEDGKVVSSEVIGSNGTGHGALAGLLAGQSVDVLICGGIGGGAQAALADAGVELCAGAKGNVDQAVEAYLKGELISTGANCDHHHEEGHSCGHHGEGHSCSDSCQGGCGLHRLSQDATWARPAVPITEVHLMTVLSLILLMIGENHWSLSAVPGR